MSKTRSPPVVWAQRKNSVILTFNVEDCKKPEIKIEEKKIYFKGVCETNMNYENTLELFADVDPEKSKYVIRHCGNIEMVLQKKSEGPYWPHLLKQKMKYHWLRVDFTKWKDEDESETEYDQEMEEMMRNLGVVGEGRPMLGSNGDEDEDVADVDDTEDNCEDSANGFGNSTTFINSAVFPELANDTELSKMLDSDYEDIINSEEEIAQVFKYVFDKDGKGFISASDMRREMKRIGENPTDKEVKEIIREVDLDGDGKISFEEFLTMMNSKGKQSRLIQKTEFGTMLTSKYKQFTTRFKEIAYSAYMSFEGDYDDDCEDDRDDNDDDDDCDNDSEELKTMNSEE